MKDHLVAWIALQVITLDSDIRTIKNEISGLKADIRDVRNEIKDVHDELKEDCNYPPILDSCLRCISRWHIGHDLCDTMGQKRPNPKGVLINVSQKPV